MERGRVEIGLKHGLAVLVALNWGQQLMSGTSALIGYACVSGLAHWPSAPVSRPSYLQIHSEGPNRNQSEAVYPEGDTVERILEVAENCPVSAITVEDSETGEKLFPPAGTLPAPNI